MRDRERDKIGRRRAGKQEEVINNTTVPLQEFGGLTRLELEQLAIYNAEKARGLMHNDGWRAKMNALQSTFDRAARDNDYNPH